MRAPRQLHGATRLVVATIFVAAAASAPACRGGAEVSPAAAASAAGAIAEQVSPHEGSPEGAPAVVAVGLDPMLVTANELRVMSQHTGGMPTLIDVRDKARFDSFHAPGALHVPLFGLARSAAIRAGQVVVFSGGYEGERLWDPVRALRAEGRPVRVVDGGFQAWCRAGGATTGPCIGHDVVGAPAFHVGSDAPEAAVLAALPAGTDDIEAVERDVARLLPGATIVRWKKVADVVRAARAAAAQGAVRRVSIVDRDGTSYMNLRDEVARSVDAHVFYVEGGLAAYRQFRDMHLAMKNRRTLVNVGQRSSDKGRTYPSAQGLTVPKGCGCL